MLVKNYFFPYLAYQYKKTKASFRLANQVAMLSFSNFVSLRLTQLHFLLNGNMSGTDRTLANKLTSDHKRIKKLQYRVKLSAVNLPTVKLSELKLCPVKSCRFKTATKQLIVPCCNGTATFFRRTHFRWTLFRWTDFRQSNKWDTF